MRDKSQKSLLSFENQIEKFLKKEFHSIEILRTAVVDNPTFLTEDFSIKLPRKLYEIRGLCAIVHFIEPDFLKFRLLLDLEENIQHFNLKEQLELKLLLYSKEICLKYLFLTKKYNSHEIFGNILKQGTKSLRNIQIIRRKFKVEKPQRKRGYHDKGSLRSPDRWLPSFDYTLTEIQNNKEFKLFIHNKSIRYLVNYLLRTKG